MTGLAQGYHKIGVAATALFCNRELTYCEDYAKADCSTAIFFLTGKAKDSILKTN